MIPRLAGLALLASVLGVALAPAPARADFASQLSLRLDLGGGLDARPAQDDYSALFELGLRADALFGADEPDTVRIGPALDLRTSGFLTFEVAGGLQLFLPTGMGFGFWTTFGGGYGFRNDQRDGPLVLGTVAFGFRPFNYFSAYGYGVGVYVSGRAAFPQGGESYEIVLGVEIDTEFLFAIPIMFLIQAFRGGDPDEPSRDED